MKRYEIKYAVDMLNISDITASILTHSASFKKAFPDRQVNNIYLDTPLFHSFYQNIEGTPRRSKMRLRWYGHKDLPDNKSTLEIKNKDAELGWKVTYPIHDLSIKNKNQLLEVISQSISLQAFTIPTLHNNYKRSYYISSDGLFRLTVDTDQSFKIPFSGIPPLSIKQYPIIIEIKFDKNHVDRARDILDYLPFRQTKNSKYTTGIKELYF